MAVILGIDPGSRITGFGVIESNGSRLRGLEWGSIRTSGESLATRLGQIYAVIQEIVRRHQPKMAAVEQVFVHINVNSALKLGQARGAALVALAQDQIVVAEYSARQVKQAVVGYGNAEKGQVQRMVKLLLKLAEDPEADAADALAVAICHAHSQVKVVP